MIAVAIYITWCAFIAFLGRHGRFGHWGMFFFSVLFTPLAGALALLFIGAGPGGPERENARLR